jgi:NAD-dependent deacetylase
VDARDKRGHDGVTQRSENAKQFDDRRYGRASEITPSWVQEILAR